MTIRGNENFFIDSGKLNLETTNNIKLAVGKEVSEYLPQFIYFKTVL